MVPGKGTMTVHTIDPGNTRMPYVVDRSGNIRISKLTQDEANYTNSTPKFAIATATTGRKVIEIS